MTASCRLPPVAWNSTLPTAMLSDALASRTAVPVRTAPLDGYSTLVTGGLVSVTVTENVPVASRPRESETLHLTVVVPTWNADPDFGLQLPGRAPGSEGGFGQLTTAVDPLVVAVLLEGIRSVPVKLAPSRFALE